MYHRGHALYKTHLYLCPTKDDNIYSIFFVSIDMEVLSPLRVSVFEQLK